MCFFLNSIYMMFMTSKSNTLISLSLGPNSVHDVKLHINLTDGSGELPTRQYLVKETVAH